MPLFDDRALGALERGMEDVYKRQAYQALGRLMTTMDEQLDMIINKMGIVGR